MDRTITVDKLVDPRDVGMKYIRDSVSPGHVAYMVAELGKLGKEEGWMFPPLDILTLPKDEADAEKWATMYVADPVAVARKVKQGFIAVVLDGVHRATAASKVDWRRPIPVRVRTPKNAGEAMLVQFEENAKGGAKLGLTMEARHEAIRLMVKTYGVSLATIAKAVGMAKSSISRIMRGVQAKPPGTPSKRGGDRKSKAAKAKAAKAASAMAATPAQAAPAAWTVGIFLGDLARMTREAASHRVEVVKWLAAGDHAKPHLTNLKTLAALTVAFLEATNPYTPAKADNGKTGNGK